MSIIVDLIYHVLQDGKKKKHRVVKKQEMTLEKVMGEEWVSLKAVQHGISASVNNFMRHTITMYH